MCIFVDVSKAFDCFEHPTLLPILKIYGNGGVTCDFVESYLQYRTQEIKIEARKYGERNDVLSDSVDLLIVSVPQGSVSVLGPYHRKVRWGSHNLCSRHNYPDSRQVQSETPKKVKNCSYKCTKLFCLTSFKIKL